jgi:hypothetical protein
MRSFFLMKRKRCFWFIDEEWWMCVSTCMHIGMARASVSRLADPMRATDRSAPLESPVREWHRPTRNALLTAPVTALLFSMRLSRTWPAKADRKAEPCSGIVWASRSHLAYVVEITRWNQLLLGSFLRVETLPHGSRSRASLAHANVISCKARSGAHGGPWLFLAREGTPCGTDHRSYCP